MSLTSVLQGNLFVKGTLNALEFDAPANSVDNAAIEGPIDADKLAIRRRSEFHCPGGTPVDGLRRSIAVVYGATGDVIAFRAGLRMPNAGAATITVDLRKNGTTILTSVITLDNSNVAYEVEDAAGFTVTTLATGDVLEIVFVATAGGGTIGSGLFVQLVHDEDAA